MNDYLRQIGLIQNLKFEFPINKAEFIAILKKNIDPYGHSFYEAWSSSKNVYKGFVDLNGFELKRRKRFFDLQHHHATAKGKLTQSGDTLIIDTEINGFPWVMIVYYAVCILIYTFVFVFFSMIKHEPGVESMPSFVPFVILLHALIMFIIPYFVMKRGVKRMKHNLEREFSRMIKK